MHQLRSFRTVDDAAQAAIGMLVDGESLSRIWRFVVVQMFDDYLSVLRHDGSRAASRMWQVPPERTGDTRVDAAFAALAEYVGRRDGWRVPSWVRESERDARPWWFVTELRGLQPTAMVQSPSSFRRRGVFITRGALERV
ncbi:MAG: hypothetical protein ACRDPW_01915 [Mycobacteriales bacterium]